MTQKFKTEHTKTQEVACNSHCESNIARKTARFSCFVYSEKIVDFQ